VQTPKTSIASVAPPAPACTQKSLYLIGKPFLSALSSPALADQLTVLFENAFQTFTFQVRLRKNPYADRDSSLSDEVLEWVTEEGGQQVKFDSDPYVSIWRIIGIKLLSLLPIEDQL
jgi:hypothetical protein